MNIKKCSRCGVEKSIDSFHNKKNENRVNSWCKQCVYERQRNRWIDRKIKAAEMFGGKCQLCGYDKNLASLNFHHVDSSKKEFSWPKLRQKKWDDVILELKKCVLICSNCHGEIHNPQLQKENLLYKSVDNCSLNRQSIEEIGPTATGICPVCGIDIYGTRYCSIKCLAFAHRKTVWPSKTELADMIENMSYRAIARKYEVSDNAIRKWARYYGILKR